MNKSSWYKALFIALLLGPALLCQTVYPVLPEGTWEKASEWVYAQLLGYQTPADSASNVAVLEVDSETLDTYGWPIARQHYVSMLDKLKRNGHPWVLSLLQFQSLDKVTKSTTPLAFRTRNDQALASAIGRYQRYIGTGLEVRQGKELSVNAERLVRQRVALSRAGKPPKSLPYLPLTFVESPRFVRQQQAFGLPARFGTEPIVRCMPAVLTDSQLSGNFSIPSSVVWASAFGAQQRIRTAGGAVWPRKGDSQPFTFKGTLAVGLKQCLTSPDVTTEAFMRQRQIETYSFAEFLEPGTKPDLSGKVVVLARGDMKKFRGTGEPTARDDAVVGEHKLVARFLDNLMSGRTITRTTLEHNSFLSWLPLLFGAVFFGLSLAFPPGPMSLMGLASLFALGGFSAWHLSNGLFWVPIQAMSSLLATTAGLGGLFVFLKYYGVRRQLRLAQRLREILSQCNSLSELEEKAAQLCSEEFTQARLRFQDYPEALYRASSDPKSALQYLKKIPKQQPAEEADEQGTFRTVHTRIGRPRGRGLARFGAMGLDVVLAANTDKEKLGNIRIAFVFTPHEEGFVDDLVETLRTEISQHWSRVKLLAEQKLLDFRYVTEQTRSDIMERFLTQVLVSKFSHEKSMDENLKTVLTPRPVKAALLQADIRGYSAISEAMQPLEMVELLRSYYINVVDAAQKVAQVKLIGDCIFMFIEDNADARGKSAPDIAMELAATLVQETEKQNRHRAEDGKAPLNFGIALHYGEVVVGNLSSDQCIDYTVIGSNVNKVARLEDLTKEKEIQSIVGANGVVISRELREALDQYAATPCEPISLERLGITVRSFSNVSRIFGLTAADATTLIAPDNRQGDAKSGSAPSAQAG